jgi:hypothetical protein
MNIDERLERLAERHEALRRAVERLGHLPQKNEEVQRREEAQRQNEILLEKNQIRIAEIKQSVDSLARIAHARERRGSDLEDGRTYG